MRLLIVILALVLVSPALAGKNSSSSQKVKLDNKSIDSGMQESGQKASLKKAGDDSRGDRKIQKSNKANQ
jgi:hypothetical protein